MAYEKQNFKNGEILPADKLNHIEDGIVDLENSQAKIDDLNITTDKAWSSRRIIDTLCPPLEETGNPVVCYPVPGYPLGVTVDFAPIQEGAGDPSPENVRPIKGRDSVQVERCGENLLNPTKNGYITYTPYGLEITYLGDNRVHLKGTYQEDGGSFVILNTQQKLLAGKGLKITGFTIEGTKQNFTLYGLRTKDETVIAMQAEFRVGDVIDMIVAVVVSDTPHPTTFAPYTGQTTTLTLPTPCYGGKLDAVTGEGQETWKLLTLDGTEDWTARNTIDTTKHRFYIKILDRTSVSSTMLKADIVSDRYKTIPANLTYRNVNGISADPGNSKIVDIYDDDYSERTLDEWKSYLAAQYAAGTPVQIAYKVATPTPITATGAQPISALSGVNTVLTDADSVTVTGRAMPEKNRNQNLSTDILFKYPRTGKVYTVKIPKFTSNPTTVCEKLDDNIGLVCEASTDTIEGRDDYAEIPLFKWYNCNYKRDENGHAYPIAIEGFDDNYTTSGNIDVGVIQITPFVKWDDSNDDYIILSITDNPTEGYRAWSTARVGGEVYPYVIHSKYISSLGTDGLLHSVPNAKPERNQSYNNTITNYAKKGSGYKGAGVERNTWQIIFTLIKYANKSSQNIFAGTTGYSFQYSASIQSAEKHTYFPVTNAQAANIIIGGYVSVGYAYKTSDTATSLDRGYDTVHSYADSVKVLKIEDLDDSNKAVYLDVKEGFDTIQHEYSDTLSAPITLTSIHWYSGSTDSVMGHHDGSFVNNNNSKYPYRVQGVEYAVGGYTVASDTVIVFTDNNEKDVYVSPSNIAHSSADATIKSNYKNVGHIPSGEWWIGDIGFDTDTNATWPTVRGSGNATGVGDYNYGSTENNGAIREYLQGGNLGSWSYAGSSYLHCGSGLGGAYWSCLSAD